MAILEIALDAGHGKNTAGKRTPDGIREWTLNDAVRDHAVKILNDYEVGLIFPDGDEGATDEGLTARKNMYLKEKVAAAVSIHHNANTGTWNSATGVEVFVDNNATADDLKLAQLIYDKLVKYTGLRGRGIKRSNFTVINQNQIPAVLVEGGFMDGTKDHPVITSKAGQEAYGKAVAEGLIEFLGLKKKVVATTTTGTFKKNDVVMFTGTKHYTGADSSTKSTCKAGKATITAIKEGAKHPYHCVRVSGEGSTVYGWVNAADVSPIGPTFVVGQKYTLQKELRVRTGAGTKYSQKTYEELTNGCQKIDLDKDGRLDKGSKITCKEVKIDSKNNIWVRCSSGWVAAYYEGKVNLK